MTNWLPVPDFPDYQVSDDGQVWSIPRRYRTRGLLLSPSTDPDGYKKVALTRDKKMYYRRLHVLVAAAFIGPRPAGLEVCHKNGDKTNNTLSNLEYGTRSKNGYDSVIHGQHAQANKTHCIRNHPLEGDNLLAYGLAKGLRMCRTCSIERKRARRAQGRWK